MNEVPRRTERWLLWALLPLVVSVWFAALAQRPLFNPDEGRYAEIPREMLAGDDWVIPHLNGLAYIEKPPLQYWITAASMALFGRTALAARLYTTLCGVGCLCVVWLLGRKPGDAESGALAAALLVSMPLFVILAQLLTLDMSLTFFLTATLGAFLLAQRTAEADGDRAPRVRSLMLLAWGATALGVLTKGVIAAAIPACVLVIYSAWSRDVAPWRRLSILPGLPLFLVITVPWHWLAAMRLPDFLTFFFVHEHLARYLTPEAQRVEPWWYFLAVLGVGTLPWILSVLRVFGSGWRARVPGRGFDAQRFLWLWAAFILVFFSLSDSKLMPYILPAFPALALLIAGSPRSLLGRELLASALLSLLLATAFLAGGLSLPRWLAGSARRDYFLPLATPLLWSAAVVGLSSLYALLKRAEVRAASVVLSTGWCVTWLLLLRAASATAPIYSGWAFAAPLLNVAADVPLYSVGTYDQTLPFYLGRTVTLVHFRGELDYGLQRDPGAEIGDMAEFIERWRNGGQAYALMERRLCEELQQAGVPMRPVLVSAGRILVARR